MRSEMPRTLVALAAALWLAGCGTNNTSSGLFGASSEGNNAFASASAADGEAAQAAAVPDTGLLGSNPDDDLGTGKKYFAAGNYGMAERYFRRAVELHPRDAEAWLGLAAAYDRLRRFDLADRAYAQAIGLVGPTVEILNNQGYSYMLRGEYAKARSKLAAAQRKDPGNKFVQNNLQLLAASVRTAKQVE